MDSESAILPQGMAYVLSRFEFYLRHFVQIITSNEKRYFEPCGPSSRGAIRMTWQSVPSGMLQRPIPRPEDILDALEKIKATVSAEDEVRFREWTERFGSNGS